MQRLLVAVFVRMVQGRFFGVLLGVGSKAIGGVAVVGGLFVVTTLEVLSSSPVLLQGVLKVMSGLFMGLNDFLVLFGMVCHRKLNCGKCFKCTKGEGKWLRLR